jgi:hypothetical protein
MMYRLVSIRLSSNWCLGVRLPALALRPRHVANINLNLIFWHIKSEYFTLRRLGVLAMLSVVLIWPQMRALWFAATDVLPNRPTGWSQRQPSNPDVIDPVRLVSA